MSKYKDKRLLMLGDGVSSCEIIQIAKKLGAYTIATDYLENSAIKKVADKSYMISTADIEQLVEMAKKERIDGILTGASEFNIDKAITLSEKLNLPFYTTREQWDITSNKYKFKEMCRKFDIPVVEEYHISEEFNQDDLMKIEYPVIIKPVDAYAGRGISVCNNENELREGYKKAITFSSSKKVILERYLTGDEVVIYYTLQDGYISLSAMCDRYTLKQEGVAPLPSAYIFPSKYLPSYQAYDDYNVRKMFKSLGMKNGFLFIQAFIDKGRVCFYEMGFRIAGAQGHKIISAVNGVNALVMLVRFSLSGKMEGWDLRKYDNPNFKKWACKLTPIVKSGKISRIEGLDEIANYPEVTEIVPINNVGDTITEIGTLKQMLTRIFMVADTKEELAASINRIQSTLKVYDENGSMMLLDGFDTNNIMK
jgi:biotin carboxylase